MAFYPRNEGPQAEAAAAPVTKDSRFTLAELRAMPNVHDGHWADIKHEADKDFTISLSRMKRADGERYKHTVRVMLYDNKTGGYTKQYAIYGAR